MSPKFYLAIFIAAGILVGGFFIFRNGTIEKSLKGDEFIEVQSLPLNELASPPLAAPKKPSKSSHTAQTATVINTVKKIKPPPPPAPTNQSADQLVSQTLPPPVNQSTPPPSGLSANHLVISEVKITGGAGETEHDFIELYNPTGASININGWKLRKRTQSGSESSIRIFGEGKTIRSHGFFLWANSGNGFASGLNADESSTATLAANNSIALLDSTGTIIDAFAWGLGYTNPFIESRAFSGAITGAQSFERKAWQNSCLSATGNGENFGNGCATDNNSSDFEILSSSNPQNSQSQTEP